MPGSGQVILSSESSRDCQSCPRSINYHPHSSAVIQRDQLERPGTGRCPHQESCQREDLERHDRSKSTLLGQHIGNRGRPTERPEEAGWRPSTGDTHLAELSVSVPRLSRSLSAWVSCQPLRHPCGVGAPYCGSADIMRFALSLYHEIAVLESASELL